MNMERVMWVIRKKKEGKNNASLLHAKNAGVYESFSHFSCVYVCTINY